jgi:hypothetical protein
MVEWNNIMDGIVSNKSQLDAIDGKILMYKFRNQWKKISYIGNPD